MGRIALSVLLGFFSPFVFIIGASPFEVTGTTSVKEVLAGCMAAALYLAICQFLVARKSGRGLRADWPILVAMVAPLLAVFLLMVVVEKRLVILAQGVPMLLAGGIGTFAGALMAARGIGKARAHGAKG